ncbi:transglutaminase family protein [Pseudanabaena sp. FACHB-2040]|uniref:transglutaminase-like domain-containing protein n=1 Tax=Pseudanabaena sp. FACHB-2040 TaxID=2692859 RepID=UPI001688AB49|nr:transglutaminase family protein [Pseudanabaena sp. FACHB-2040]MBD2257423.1 transglutaminase family protein [Pseudanabaena sp. FACHB-2040]
MLETSSPAPASTSHSTETLPQRLIQPIGAKALHGLAIEGSSLLAVDPYRGYLLRIDPKTDNATILNSQQVDTFESATGVAVWEDTLWFTRDNSVFRCRLDDLTPQPVVTLPYTLDGVAVWENTLYITCRKASQIFIHDGTSGKRITQFSAPGIGTEDVAVWGEYLWVCDQTEQSVYCLDRATGDLLMKVLTPFPTPTGIAVLPGTTPEQGTVWVAYANEEPYVRDNPNAEVTFELTFRDRTFIHPLKFHRRAQENFCLSNGYLLEMAYVEEIDALEAVQLSGLKWHMALPTNTDRQTVRSVEPVGIPFEEVSINGQRVARFSFDTLQPNERHLFGWKALIEVYGIKYLLTPRHVEQCPPLPASFHEKYLVDDDDLSMDQPLIQAAAESAVRSETNLLRKVLSIRDYVYDQLTYAVTPAIDTPDVVLERGQGSCGEYVGLLLALLRLNGIACRTVGRYKCPPQADQLNIFLEPDFNHVWIEFYIPGYGWVPMESNPDDIDDGGPYPTRFFMGLPWWHVEMGKDVSFEKLTMPQDNPEVRLGNLAINHVRFRILSELNPWEFGKESSLG